MVDLHLAAHNVFSIIATISLVAMALFTFINAPKREANITFALLCLSGAVFWVDQVIGVNVTDPLLSRDILMGNLLLFFAGIFQVHSISAFLGTTRKNIWFISFIYAVGIGLVVFFALKPDLFLLPSVPKMYFTNYYNPGPLNWVRVVFLFGVALPYALYLLFVSYRNTTNIDDRRRYKYLAMTLSIVYALIFIPNFLVYNVQVDPLWGFLCSFGALPFAYGAIRYGLFDIRVIAKQAVLYSLAIVIVGGVIVFLTNANNWILDNFPLFPNWVIPLVASFMTVTVGIVVWRKLRESDLLKYEFITTVTHKFRTPLTHIKWASENLSATQMPPEQRTQLNYIQTANMKLVELTNLLMNVSEAEGASYDYRLERGNLSAVAEEVITSLEDQLKAKNVHIVRNLAKDTFANFDASRIRFIIQTFVENAIHYTPENAAINVIVVKEGKEIRCSVIDNGIGIPKDEIPLLFSKFYRGHAARLADTEGMGIGLFIAKEIIGKHNGRIWAESPGQNKGSTFSFTLPAAD